MPYQKGDPKIRTNKNPKHFTSLLQHLQENTDDSNKRGNKDFNHYNQLSVVLTVINKYNAIR
jgi:hypothetical protein